MIGFINLRRGRLTSAKDSIHEDAKGYEGQRVSRTRKR
jgi:hypothetical protein